MKKNLPWIIMIIVMLALSYLVSFLISYFYNYEVYNVMTVVGILIMLFGGLASIDENTIRYGGISAPHLNTMMNADETGTKKLHELYFDGVKGIARGYFSSKFKIILTGFLTVIISIIISMSH